MTARVFRDNKTMARVSRRVTDVSSTNTRLTSEVLSEDTSSIYPSLEVTLPRTPLLIMDYVQFLAARTIQRNWRCFSGRKRIVNFEKAAITIQRWWRGYHVRSQFMSIVECKLQNTLVNYYNNAATKIQALFRGWWTRRTVHDMSALKRMQTCAAQDLLNCVAFKLHHLLRTYSIPGVYSIRDSKCLSRVEKLLASIRFRFHNGRVHNAMMSREAVLKTHRQKFRDNAYYTTVPYKGPNDKRACKPHCEEFLNKTADLDSRMYKIIEAYDESLRDAKSRLTQYNMAERRRRRRIRLILEQRERHKCNFCADVVASMRRWKIWDTEKFTIAKDIFRNPGNLEQFLNEASEIVEEIQGRCHCKITLHDVVQCH
ncbi:uncharacterized protein LOC117783539 [Drosophila innubila]|uniref:uncharacterized protein LOC117783539 n=1 Tax=Drosophila innubila TaxID=198719 RepID=UPI00148B7969|nr:uncharacterized protein LOC117783539 [Drosophila innubila]